MIICKMNPGFVLTKSLIITALVFFKVAAANESVLCENWNCGGSVDAPQGSICEGWKFSIEPDMQIHDSDLTEQSAQSAANWLAENVTKDGFLNSLGKENRLKRIRGYLLKNDYLESSEADRDNAKKRYCMWLKTEGFWYD